MASPLILKYVIPSANTTVDVGLNFGTINSVVWGDGTTNTSLMHTYSAAGTYTVTVNGTGVTKFDNNTSKGIQYLTECVSFGEIGLTDLSYAFYGATSLTVVPSSLPTNSTVTDMSGMFSGATAFNQAIGLWSTGSVQNMSGMFYGASAFNQPIGNWNTSSATDMVGMFDGATSFNQPIGLWSTGSVQSMSGMFSGASAFNQPIGNWNTSSATDMVGMFYGATSFNQPIGLWSTGSVQNMSGMFYGATAFNQAIGLWSTGSVQNMSSMLDDTAISVANYDSILNGWASQTVKPNVLLGANGLVYSTAGQVGRNRLTSTYSWTITGDRLEVPPVPPVPPIVVCFKEGSKILTNKGYQKIERLKKGDLVKTLKHGYVAISLIGNKLIYHPASEKRIKEQLYSCKPNEFPEIFEELVVTGCHSILVNDFASEKERYKALNIHEGVVYITDGKYRLPACASERSVVYRDAGNYRIYHFSLEHSDDYMNYGVYANGLLVETCSKRNLVELSGMVCT